MVIAQEGGELVARGHRKAGMLTAADANLVLTEPLSLGFFENDLIGRMRLRRDGGPLTPCGKCGNNAPRKI